MTRIEVILAFDFGLRHIGVAVGQTLTQTATGIGEAKANNGKPITWTPLDELVGEWQPGQLIVGLPLNMDGSESDMCERARRFARRLEGRYHLPVAMVDERLTSFEAKELSGEKDGNHALAARVIAEAWLGENRMP
jgi:putative Holliday junction resolvase